jgi:hypothetical protein
MTHIEALNKLISRNKSFVRKNGASDYSRETDTIINALLAYVKQYDSEIERLRVIEQNRDVCFQLFGISEEFKQMDNEFIQRYLKFEIVTGIHEFNGGQIEDFELTEKKIINSYWFAQRWIDDNLKAFNDTKEILNGDLELIKNVFPMYYNWIKYGYTEEQIKQELKRKIYYNHE